MNGKYIIVEENGGPWAIIFPASVSHSSAVNPKNTKVLSAGFFKVDEDNNIKTSGQSTSLNVSSKPSDAETIKLSLFMAGFQSFCPVTQGA